jgi:hypothetical protein
VPNPTTDKIVLSLGNVDLALSYVLYDLSGRLVLNALVQGLKPKLPCKICLGVYILKVNKNNTELKTFKIIKK